MIPNKLFHYTSASTALEKILFTQKIKIGQIKFTNDPRETKNWALHPTLSEIPSTSLPLSQSFINKELTRIKQEEWKVVCFSTHSPKYRQHPKSNIEEGFLHGACRPRMWATYAENHTGICLKFNGKELGVKIKSDSAGAGKGRKVFHGKVKYVNYGDSVDSLSINYTELSKGDITQGIREHLFRHYKKFFLMKSTDWKTEHEYRWLVHSKNLGDEFLPIKGVIEEVIIGADFPQAYLPSLFELCDQLEIPARGITWVCGVPSISDCIHKVIKL